MAALGDLGDRRAIGPLQRLLEQEQDLDARDKIRLSLAKLGRPYLGYFISGLSDRDTGRRDSCIGALGTLKDTRAVPYLLKVLEENTDTWGLSALPTPSHESRESRTALSSRPSRERTEA